jgi:hypothetical protein
MPPEYSAENLTYNVLIHLSSAYNIYTHTHTHIYFCRTYTIEKRDVTDQSGEDLQRDKIQFLVVSLGIKICKVG